MKLTSNYAGIEIASPIMVGASPLALDVDRVKELAAHGAGAIVMPSIFEEQIVESQLRESTPHADTGVDQQTFGPLPKSGPDLDVYNGGVAGYLRSIQAAKEATEIPVFANINCLTTGSWMSYAKDLESAGADAIELNLYHYEVDPDRFAEEIEKVLVDRVSRFCDESPLPVAVKLLPQYTCLPNVAFRISGAGAKSVCLFGQSPAFYLTATKHIGYRWRLTTRADLRSCLEGIHQVRGVSHNLTLAASGGIQSPDDALTAFRLGADVVMLTSVVYQQGGAVIETILDAVKEELKNRRMSAIQELIGSQSGGFNPYPEAVRRQDYTASLAELNTGEMESEAK